MSMWASRLRETEKQLPMTMLMRILMLILQVEKREKRKEEKGRSNEKEKRKRGNMMEAEMLREKRKEEGGMRDDRVVWRSETRKEEGEWKKHQEDQSIPLSSMDRENLMTWDPKTLSS